MSDRPIQLAALTDKNIDFSNLDKGDLCSSESTTAATASVSYLGFSVRDYEIYFQINLFFLLQNCLTLRKNFILCLMLWYKNHNFSKYQTYPPKNGLKCARRNFLGVQIFFFHFSIDILTKKYWLQRKTIINTTLTKSL